MAKGVARDSKDPENATLEIATRKLDRQQQNDLDGLGTQRHGAESDSKLIDFRRCHPNDIA